jgi:hypothetical protein
MDLAINASDPVFIREDPRLTFLSTSKPRSAEIPCGFDAQPSRFSEFRNDNAGLHTGVAGFNKEFAN